MVTLLLLGMVLPLEITEADVRSILESVVGFVVAQEEERSTDIGRALSERPVFVTHESAAAFTWVVAALRRIPDGGEVFSARDYSDIIACRPTCRISGDGVVLTVERFQKGRKEGEYFLSVRARWNPAAAADGLAEATETYIITGKAGGGWTARADLAIAH